MSKKDNIVGIMKQNYTKHVYFSFSNPLTTELSNSLGEPTIRPGELTLGQNDRNSCDSRPSVLKKYMKSNWNWVYVDRLKVGNQEQAVRPVKECWQISSTRSSTRRAGLVRPWGEAALPWEATPLPSWIAWTERRKWCPRATRPTTQRSHRRRCSNSSSNP